MTSIDREEILSFAHRQTERLLRSHPGHFPKYTVAGKWNCETYPKVTHWTEGFYPGLMWLYLNQTGDPRWKDRAIEHSRKIEPFKTDTSLHDLGFLFMPTFGAWYENDPSDELLNVLITAAETFCKRLQPKGYLAACFGKETTMIDIMMNIELLLWVSEKTGDPKYREVALSHARYSQENLVREDGSVVQTLRNGHPETHQGSQADSCWSRGLAWAITGFATTYQYTKDSSFKLTAEKCADYYIRHAPDHGVPPWDFSESNPFGLDRLDSSAAAPAAIGFRLLGREEYFERILATLCTRDFVPIENSTQEGILLHGTYNRNDEVGVDESLIWGDYFFIKALVSS